MLNWFRMRRVARRLGLRDKGQIEKWFQDEKAFHRVCKVCQTPLRIAIIEREQRAAEWCWRCEWVLPKTKVFTPSKESETPTERRDNVYPFRRRKD